MSVTQRKLAAKMKLSILAYNRPKSLPNNEKQLLPPKMRDREVPRRRGTQISCNPLIHNPLQEVILSQVYVKPIGRNPCDFGVNTKYEGTRSACRRQVRSPSQAGNRNDQ